MARVLLGLWRMVTMKSKLILVLIIALAFILRAWQLDKFPAGFNADEAAIGYNAYSIIQTGRDEYGEILPLSFKSFGDYKPGLYFYFVMPFVAILGLDEWAVRLPSAILGTGLIFLIYLISVQIFKDKKTGILSALLLAINPWAINFSRGGWETNAATFFITLGVYLLIKGLKKNVYLFYSLLAFLISIYLYQSPRLTIPLFIFCVLIFFWKEIIRIIKNNIKKSVVSFIILLLLSFPIALQFLSGGGSERFQGLSFLSDIGPISRINELRGEHDNPDSLLSKLAHNKIAVYGISFLGGYLDHFSGDFLFINGDPLIRNKIPEAGQFYLIEALFLIVGLLFLIKFESRLKYLIVFWVLTAPAASAMTYQTPHAVRALSMVVPLTLLMGYGFSSLLNLFKNKKVQIIAGLLLLIILSFEFVHYLESYYVHYPKRYPLSWEYGFSQMVQKLDEYEVKFNKVVVTDRYDQPYILVLFFKKYNPAKYQPQAVLSERDKFNFGTVKGFDKYEFHQITPEEIKQSKNTLFIAVPDEIGNNSNILDTIYFPNGERAFIFITN